MMEQKQARAVARTIFKRHPFFQGYAMFGWDWRTMRICYPVGARILRKALDDAKEGSADAY